MGQSLLQSKAGITKWSNLLKSRVVITKLGSTPSNGEWYEWSPILTDKANAG